MKERSVGVFICRCGKEIGGTLDVAALADRVNALDGVAWVEQGDYWCLPHGSSRIRKILAEKMPERALVAGCSPRTHDPLFRRTVGDLVDPAYLRVLNVRDVCVRPHKSESPAAMSLAAGQIAMAVADLALQRSSQVRSATIAERVAVIGGGIAGLTAALALSDAGIPVTLVERREELGGAASRDTPESISALISEKIDQVRRRENIRILCGVEPNGFSGPVGDYAIGLSDGTTFRAGVVIIATGSGSSPVPQEPSEAKHLADLFRLPVDTAGHLVDMRLRVRPADHIERGVYVCGAAHYPCDPMQAVFQAYITASQAIQHVRRRTLTSASPAASIAAERCNGCGECMRVCPFQAITLERRAGNGVGLARVDELVCNGCGNCVSACPVAAADIASMTEEQFNAQVNAAVASDLTPAGSVMLVVGCEWSGYSAAEMAGVRGLSSPANARLLRVRCTGRLQPGWILGALQLGVAGVLVLGCAPGMCHYERGNEHAASACEQATGLGHLLGLDHRIALEWIAPDDGVAYARATAGFAQGLELT